MLASALRVTSRLRRNNSTVPPSPSPAASSSTPSDGSATPPWLNRWLRLWDRESGTHEILQLKQNVDRSSLAFDDKRRQVSRARTTLDRALQSFEESQATHTQLLQSRDRWTPSQAMEFAKLLEEEVRIRKQLESAKKDLSTLESEQSRCLDEYMNDLRRRYHEEQLWQDKWRVYGTLGTWGLIALNSAVFFISQYLWRLRETQRMKDIGELLHQSLRANEGTLQALQEQSQIMIKGDSGGGSMVEQCDGSQSTDASERDTSHNKALVEANAEKDGATRSELKTAPSSEPQKKFTPTFWSRIKQYTANTSKKWFFSGENRVDVPSAILGASVTGMAWLAVTLSSSRQGGGPQ